jgi:hypothetical protein
VTATQILDSAIATATGFDAAPFASDAYAKSGEIRFSEGSPLFGAVIGLHPTSAQPVTMSGFSDPAIVDAWSAVVVEAMEDAR